jgi:hypothetical protein
MKVYRIELIRQWKTYIYKIFCEVLKMDKTNKFGIKKLSYTVEFFDGTKFEAKGEYVKKLDSVDFDFKSLGNDSSTIDLEEEHCAELAKIFNEIHETFKDMQDDEDGDTEEVFDEGKHKK